MLKRFWQAWLKFGHWMGDQVARVVLVVFYFTIALPFGLLVRLTQDPLDIRRKERAGWLGREPKDKTLDDARRAF